MKQTKKKRESPMKQTKKKCVSVRILFSFVYFTERKPKQRSICLRVKAERESQAMENRPSSALHYDFLFPPQILIEVLDCFPLDERHRLAYASHGMDAACDGSLLLVTVLNEETVGFKVNNNVLRGAVMLKLEIVSVTTASYCQVDWTLICQWRSSLRVLCLVDVRLTNAGITRVGELHGLQELDFGDNWRITDVSALAPLQCLRKLVLDNCGLTTEGIAPLAELKSLEELYLRYIRSITDISALAPLTQLRKLDLRNSGVTIEEAKVALLPHIPSLVIQSTKMC